MSPDYKYPPGARHVSAIYSTNLGAYENNPLIAALQPSWDAEQIAGSMTWWPNHDASCHALTPSIRAEMLMELQDGFETLPQHVAIMSAILGAMRRCCFGREAYVHGHTESILARAVAPEGQHCNGVRIAGTSNSMLIHGLPGTGKSSLMMRMSALLPQLIDHTEFQGKPWPCRQVTFLRVAVQQNWTDKALAQAILEEFDRVAGTNYTERLNAKGNASGYAYLMKFGLAANNHGLGMLILDEVQLLKSNTTLLNFVLNFSTTNNVLLVLVGTPSSVEIMREDPRFMRRAETVFDPELKRFEFPAISAAQYDAMLLDPMAEADLWTWFVQAFWPRQFTAKPVALTHALSLLLHHLSAGITHYAVSIFITAQLLRIGTEKDYLDEDALKEAYVVSCSTSMEYLEDLRKSRWERLKKYADFSHVSFHEIAQQAAAKRQAKVEKETRDKLAMARREAEQSKRKRQLNDGQKPDAKPAPKPVGDDDLPRATRTDFL